MKRIISTIVSVTWCSAPLLAGGVASSATAGPEWIATGRHGMVASDSAEASRAGLEILEAGGNAIDAATAVSFALAVTRPYSTGLGGGGFLIARFADGRLVALDFRETAPAAATANMYVRAESLQKTRASRNGHLAVAVPGLVAGRCQALAQYGTLPLGRVLRAAIRLATNGFAIDAHFVKSSGAALSEYETDPKLLDRCGYVYRVHLNNGRLHTVGHTLRQPALARLLEGVARDGGDFFYRGPVAQSIQREMQRGGGIITAKDLAEYQPLTREPVVGSYREFKVISMPPPSSGGVALLQALNVLEAFDMRGLFSADRPLATHYTVEAMKHAFADRARWFGDADFVHVPVGLLTSKAYAKDLSARLSPTGIAHWEQYGVRQLPDDAGTSHFCVVDKWGNAVVSTETINTSFGSLAAVDEWGLILNNQMDDFTAEPGKPNAFGLSELGDTLRLSSVDPDDIRENIDAVHVRDSGNIILSTAGNAALGVNAVSFGNGDLVEYDPQTGMTTLLFSELQFVNESGGENIDAVSIDPATGNLILSTGGPAVLPAAGGTTLSFGNGDLVAWDPTTETATLVFSEALFDRELGELVPNENIDAVHALGDGVFIISTGGPSSIGGQLFDDGDLIRVETDQNGTNLLSVSRFFSEALFAIEPLGSV
ncbi:MAG: gamma-glutamyltransferase, partial [Planctomycetes bacterium]|nr:gamma-glutamyltransferase [Planctomycetota bacterium]